MWTTRSIILAVALALLPLAAFAQLPNQCVVSPAAIGSGPANSLAPLMGTDFDRAYMRSMYQLHSTMASLDTLAASRASDPQVRNLASHMRDEQVDMNRKLLTWYSQLTGGLAPVVNVQQYNLIVAGLNCPNGMSFSAAWAQAMIPLLMQQQQAADLARVKAVDPSLRDQAGIAVRASRNEIAALQQWLQTGDTGRGYAYVPYYPYYPYYYGNYYAPYYGPSFGFDFGFGSFHHDRDFDRDHHFGGGIGAGPGRGDHDVDRGLHGRR